MNEHHDTAELRRDDTAPEMDHLEQLTRVLEEQLERHGPREEPPGARAMALEQSAERHHAIVHTWYVSGEFDPSIGGSDLGVVVIDRGHFQFSNDAFDAWFGYDRDEMSRLGPLEIAVPDDWPTISEQFRRRLSGEVDHVQYAFRGRTADGEIVELVSHCTGVQNGGRPMIVGTFVNVTEQVRYETKLLAMQDELREQAYHDELTGLFNSRYVDEMLDERLAVAEAAGEPVCLILAAIDDFGAILDEYGPAIGDEVVSGFGEFVRRQFRPSDVFCRYGTEEFIVVLLACPHAVGLARALQLRTFEVSITTGEGLEIAVPASYGSASFPRNGQNTAEVMEAARRAMRAAD